MNTDVLLCGGRGTSRVSLEASLGDGNTESA